MKRNSRNFDHVAVVYMGLAVISLQVCGCGQLTRNGTASALSPSHRKVVQFLDALGDSKVVVNSENTYWMLIIDPGTGRAWAWLGEVRQEVLHVVEVRYDVQDLAFTIIGSTEYNHFTPPRELALANVFSMNTHFVSGRDYWASAEDAFAGYGRNYFSTVHVGSNWARELITKRIAGEQIYFEDLELNGITPIELGLPWLFTVYYSLQ